MSALRKIEQDEMRAELASLNGLIASLRPADVLTKISLESRYRSLQAKLETLSAAAEATRATVSLYFSGRPVVGSMAIDSRFGAAALSSFQDLVSKILTQETGNLGRRGPVPNPEVSALHVTDIARGSFGFVLEEIDQQEAIFDSPLKHAVDSAGELLKSFALDSDEQFQDEISSFDERVLDAAGAFLGTLNTFGATARILANEAEYRFASDGVERAVGRARTTSISEEEVELHGVFGGALPESHLFEFRPLGEGEETFRGKVDKSITSAELTSLNVDLTGQPAVARMLKKVVRKEGEVVRTNFTLLSITRRYPAQF